MPRRTLPLLCCGLAASAHAAPVFTLIEEGHNANSRWLNQIGAQGHVVYFKDTELRRWDGASSEVLHTVGIHLDGLQPDATTVPMLGVGGGPIGYILGVDCNGGVSVLLEGDLPGGAPQSRSRLIASTTHAGGFRAVMASPMLAADPSVAPAAAASLPVMGTRRNDSGHTIARGVLSGERSFWTISPDLQHENIFTSGQTIPGTQQTGVLASAYQIAFGGADFGTAMYSDIASNGSAAHYFWYDTGHATPPTGLLRTHNGTTELIASATVEINNLRLALNQTPKIRINASGRVLAAGDFLINRVSAQNSLVLIDPDAQSHELIASGGQSLPMTNYANISFGMHQTTMLGEGTFHYTDDGTMMIEVPGFNDPHIIHRSSTGDFNMVLTGDPDFLGVPGSQIEGISTKLLMSTDATSAAGSFRVDSRTTLFHAFADGSVTRLLAVADAFEVAPGDIRNITSLTLLDVNGPYVLFAARFDDLSSGMFSVTVPSCRVDLNNDGVVDADDFFLFLNFFAAGDPRADINGDGVIDTDDFFDYLDLFAQGC